MREFIIDENSSNQRIDRYLQKLLPNASKLLIQKSIRKKNIKINNKKATSNQALKGGDRIQIYFSDETIDKFRAQKKEEKKVSKSSLGLFKNPLFENKDIVVINKPVGLLTQPDKSGKESISDIISQVLPKHDTFSPAPLNRLDTNTSGIIIIPKNYQTQKLLSKQLQDHNTNKYYLTLVKGELKEPNTLVDNYSKDSKKNIANINSNDGEKKVKLSYSPILSQNGYTLLKVNLETGKSHQIRAQLSNHGYPIIGDPKYGDSKLNKYFKDQYGLNNQLLHAYHYQILDTDGNYLVDIKANIPKEFLKILENELNFNYGLLEETTLS